MRDVEEGHPAHISLGDLETAVDSERSNSNSKRVFSVTLSGQTFWVKQEQERGLLLRLRKGDASSLLQRERKNMALLLSKGVPVPKIVLAGDEYFVSNDVGSPLDSVILGAANNGHDISSLLDLAAKETAQLHRSSIAHGGLHLRNMCVSGDHLAFIDLENATPSDAAVAAMAYDLRVLVFSVLAVFPNRNDLAEFLVSKYQEYGPSEVIDEAQRWCKTHWWLANLAAPLRWHEAHFRPNRKYRQYGAIAPALAVFDRLRATGQ